MATRGLALATTHRVIHRVHRHTTRLRTNAEPAASAGFSELDVHVLGIAGRSDRCHAVCRYQARLTRRKLQGDVLAFARGKLCVRSCRTGQLSALTRLHLDGVNEGADRDASKRQTVARLRRSIRSADDLTAELKLVRRDDVSLFAVGIDKQRDPRRPVWIVLDCSNAGGNAVLVSLEVNDTVAPLVATTLMTHRNASIVVSPALTAHRRQQVLFELRLCNLRKVGLRPLPLAGSRRFELFNRHLLYRLGLTCRLSTALRPVGKSDVLEEVDLLTTLLEGNNGLLVRCPPPFEHAAPRHLPLALTDRKSTRLN